MTQGEERIESFELNAVPESVASEEFPQGVYLKLNLTDGTAPRLVMDLAMTHRFIAECRKCRDIAFPDRPRGEGA